MPNNGCNLCPYSSPPLTTDSSQIVHCSVCHADVWKNDGCTEITDDYKLKNYKAYLYSIRIPSIEERIKKYYREITGGLQSWWFNVRYGQVVMIEFKESYITRWQLKRNLKCKLCEFKSNWAQTRLDKTDWLYVGNRLTKPQKPIYKCPICGESR